MNRRRAFAPLRGASLAYLLAVVNAIVIGVSFSSVKQTLAYASPFDSLAYRFSAAVLIFLLLAPFKVYSLHYKGKPLHKLVVLASVYPLGFFLLQVLGLQYATSSEGGMINAFTPIVTLILSSIFLKESTTKLQKISAFLTVGGISFILLMQGMNLNLSNLKGLFFLLLATLFFASYSVLARSISRQFNFWDISFFMVVVGCIATVSHSIIRHLLNGTLVELVIPFSHSSFFWLIGYLGVVQLTTALLSNYIVSQIEAWKMGVFINLSTVVSMLVGAVFLGEKIFWYHLVGTGCIILGVIGTGYFGKRRCSDVENTA